MTPNDVCASPDADARAGSFYVAAVWPALAKAPALDPMRAGGPLSANAARPNPKQDPERYQISAGVAALRASPQDDAEMITQARLGEELDVFLEDDGWAWAQSQRDGYVGWVSMDAVSRPVCAPTHRVRALRAYAYSAPSVKAQAHFLISLGGHVTATGRTENSFVAIERAGWVAQAALEPVLDPSQAKITDGSVAGAVDWVSVAERLLGTPYQWGGVESLGLDCSGLIVVALEAAGVLAPRDTGLQERVLGAPVAGGADAQLARGDLVFWKGHVGVMLDAERLLHANAHHMEVAAEPLAGARARIAAAYGPITSVRRF